MLVHVPVQVALALVRAVEGKVIKNTFHKLFYREEIPIQNPPRGLYSYHLDTHEGYSHIHLRVDEGGDGLLIINANRVLHLNNSAALMAFVYLENFPENLALKMLTHNFRVSKPHAKNDYAKFVQEFSDIITPSDLCPIHDLDIEVTFPFSSRPSAPYRMDLAITYLCNNNCLHCYNQPQRINTELSTSDWKTILSKLWDIGIPHVVFTGGEPTLRQDLSELIAFAQKKGQVTGLNTNGRRLSDIHYVNQLVDSGLDHVQITVESHDPDIHDNMVNHKGAWVQTVEGIKNVLDSPLYVMTNTTLLKQNSPSLSSTLKFLADLGVPTIGLNGLIYSGRGQNVGTGLSEGDLPELLELARESTDQHQQRLIWYTPTEYCHFDPMQLELGVKGCTAALYNMCIEPDGSVIPCQSFYEGLGNILTVPWKSIWEHDRAKWLRDRQYIREECTDCVLLAECGGGCPLVNLDMR